MSRRKLGLRSLGLSVLAVFGLIVFLVAGAQADWINEGKTFTELSISSETVSAEAHTEFNLLVPAQNLEILCSVLKQKNSKLIPSPTIPTATGELELTKCKTIQNKVDVSKNCTPKEPIIGAGKAKLILHNTEIAPGVFTNLTYWLFEPNKNAKGELLPLATLLFGEFCSLGEENKLTGSLVAECLTAALGKAAKQCEAELVTHLLEEAPDQTLFGADGLKFNKNEAFLDGIAKVKLTGAKGGKKWSGVV